MSKSIKFKNNTYLDSTSIVNGTTTLNTELSNMKNETGTRLKHYDTTSETNLNNFTTYGIYQLGRVYTNAPVSSTIYGTLVVLTSRRHSWTASDQSNWIWQLIFTGYGIYMRQSSNSNTWGAWVQISSGSPNAIVGSTEKYTKYANGLLVQHFEFSITCAISNAWGSGFEVQISGGTFPVAFKKLYSCNVTSKGRACFIEFQGSTLTQAFYNGFIYRPVSDGSTANKYDFYCIAYGTWK